MIFPKNLAVGQRWIWKNTSNFVGEITGNIQDNIADIRLIKKLFPCHYTDTDGKLFGSWRFPPAFSPNWTYLQGQEKPEEIK